MDKSTFCILPWIHTYVTSSNGVRACCEQQKDIDQFDTNLSTTINLPNYKKLRKELYNGIQSSDCSYCWKKENKNAVSMRQQFNHNFKELVNKNFVDSITNYDDFSLNDNFKLRYLDVRSSNLCNYKCRFCGLSLSSGWYKYYKLNPSNEVVNKLKANKNFDPKTGVIEFDISLLQLEKHIPYIEKVNLAGGEPVMMPDTYTLLEKFIDQKRYDSEWNIISNTSKLNYGKKNILELLSYFRKWNWSMSIDAVESAHTYLRSDVDDWNTVYDNSKQLINFKKNNKKSCMTLSVHSSVSWLSLYRFYDVWKLYNKHVDTIKANVVLGPDEYAIDQLPREELIKAHIFYSKKYNKHKRNVRAKPLKMLADYLEGCVSHASRDQGNIIKAIAKQKEIDQLRKQSLFDTFPEWKHLENYNG